MIFKTFATVLAILPTLAFSVCENDDTVKFPWAGKTYSCKKLRFNAGPRFNLCQDSAVRNSCKQTCGLCCEDSATYKFGQKSNGVLRDCKWLLQSPKNETDVKRTKLYCDGYWSNGRAVRDACHESCNLCFSDVLVDAPTPAPTEAPTPAPTPVPTAAPISNDGKSSRF